MNILSLFDGMACARLALDRANIPVTNYYASEVDKYAMQVAMANYPGIHQLGDVRNIDVATLPKIDLLVGGSPCQGFSFAGKQLNFNDPRSALFFEYVRILQALKAINPDVLFLLENVRMAQKHADVISNALGIQPIFINSQLLSAQSRPRYYWTNIHTQPRGIFGNLTCLIPQPKDKGLLIKHILETNVPEKYYFSESKTKYILNSIRNRVTTDTDSKAKAVLANQARQGADMLCLEEPATGAIRGRNHAQELELREGGKYNCVTSVTKDNVVIEPAIIQSPRGYNQGGLFTQKSPTLTGNCFQENHAIVNFNGTPKPNQHKSGCVTAGGHSGGYHSDMDLILETKNYLQWNGQDQEARAYYEDTKQGTLDTKQGRAKVLAQNRIRRYTPTEFAALQTVPAHYIKKEGKYLVSETQLYKMLGNGFTVDVIAYIFSYIKQ